MKDIDMIRKTIKYTLLPALIILLLLPLYAYADDEGDEEVSGHHNPDGYDDIIIVDVPIDGDETYDLNDLLNDTVDGTEPSVTLPDDTEAGDPEKDPPESPDSGTDPEETPAAGGDPEETPAAGTDPEETPAAGGDSDYTAGLKDTDSKHEEDIVQIPEPVNTYKEPGKNTLTGEGDVVLPDAIICVTVPIALNFTIDPYELTGNGQIYSDTQYIENFGTSDVLLTITDIEVIFANNADFLPLSHPFGIDTQDRLKAIYLVVDFQGSQSASVTATAQNASLFSTVLYAAGNGRTDCAMSVSGSVNTNPENNWAKGDVKISITYTLDAIIEG